jgi:hypothetical protein
MKLSTVRDLAVTVAAVVATAAIFEAETGWPRFSALRAGRP